MKFLSAALRSPIKCNSHLYLACSEVASVHLPLALVNGVDLIYPCAPLRLRIPILCHNNM